MSKAKRERKGWEERANHEERMRKKEEKKD